MNCNYFDFLIDKALEIKDFEWVEELKSQQNRYMSDLFWISDWYKDDSYLVEADNNTDVHDDSYLVEAHNNTDVHDDSYLVEAHNNTDNLRTDFNKISVALEDIVGTYCILKEVGIANINFKGDYSVDSNLIVVEKDYSKKGDLLRYRPMFDNEKMYLLGYLAGAKEVIRQAEAQTEVIDDKKWWQFWK